MLGDFSDDASRLAGALGDMIGSELSPGSSTPARPVKVLYVRDHLIWSGGTVYFLDVLPRLNRARLDTRFAVLKMHNAAEDQFQEAGIAVISLDWRTSRLPALAGILRQIRTFQPDLLHLSGPLSMLWGQTAGILTQVPAVTLFNNALAQPAPQVWMQRRLSRGTKAGVAVSGAMADWAADTYAIPRERIEVIYSGRDLGEFLDADTGPTSPLRRRIRTELGLDERAKVLILAGRVVDAQKGQLGMIRSMPALRARVPDAHLLIVGDGRDIETCRALVEELGLSRHVTITGMRHDMPDLLAASDLAIVPSLVEEAFGFVALEALACGRPVVAFRAGGLPEAVHDGKHGLLVPKGDWKGLVNAAAACLEDQALYDRFVAAGRPFARGFSLDAHCERLTRFHERLAGATPSRSSEDPVTAEPETSRT